MNCCDTIDILRALSAGTQVTVWFDNSPTPYVTFFQFYMDNEAAFTGGSFGPGLTYVQATDISAIRVMDTDETMPFCEDDCEYYKRDCKKTRDDCFCCDPMSILRRIRPNTTVRVWFDSSLFQQTTFQRLCGNMAVFTGGTLDGGFTYVKASEIRAISVNIAPNCPADENQCDERDCKKPRLHEMCCSPMAVLRELNQGSTVLVWFDTSGFLPGIFQCIVDDMAVFTGGAFDGDFTYIKACDIRSVQVGSGLVLGAAGEEA